MNAATNLRVSLANLADPADGQAVIALLDHYARDIMGGGRSLSQEVKDVLLARLREQAGCRVFLAHENRSAVGLAICFTSFSTFQAQPLLNIHDLAVHASARGRGIGKSLLAAVEAEARAMGCCKLTLEVRGDNDNARRLYDKFGFDAGGPEGSAMLFLSKKLVANVAGA